MVRVDGKNHDPAQQQGDGGHPAPQSAADRRLPLRVCHADRQVPELPEPAGHDGEGLRDGRRETRGLHARSGTPSPATCTPGAWRSRSSQNCWATPAWRSPTTGTSTSLKGTSTTPSGRRSGRKYSGRKAGSLVRGSRAAYDNILRIKRAIPRFPWRQRKPCGASDPRPAPFLPQSFA